VYGSSSYGTGVYGVSPSQGVRGYAYASTGAATGVTGESASDSGTGVIGWTSATTGTNTGVYGLANGIYDGTTGVWGYVPATSGNLTQGVYGRSDSNGGAGVLAHNYWYGVGLRAHSYGGNLIEGWSGDPLGGTLQFYVDNSGNLYASGSKSAVVQTQDYGSRRLYAVESPEVWFEDFGSGQLVNGEATISFDSIFAQTVNLTETYHVYLTPIGDEPVLLFVTHKGPASFTVRGVTLNGQPASVAFDWRMVAKRLGYEDQRLEPADARPAPKEPSPGRKAPATPPLPERPPTPVPPVPQKEGR